MVPLPTRFSSNIRPHNYPNGTVTSGYANDGNHKMLDLTHDWNMLKQVKEAKEKLEDRERLEQSNLKHLAFHFSFVVVLLWKKNTSH